MAILANESGANFQEKDSTLKERDSTKAEVSEEVEAFKKTPDFAQIVRKHCLAKLNKIFGDLVTQIHEVQPECPIDQVKGF